MKVARTAIGPTTLALPDGGELPVLGGEVRVYGDARALGDLRLRLVLAWDVWTSADACAAFGLSPEHREPGELEGSDGGPVAIEARLAEPGLTALAILAMDRGDLVALCRPDTGLRFARRASSWEALWVVQGGGAVQRGFTTRSFEAVPPEGGWRWG